jgi:formate dehydrogenase
MLAALFREHDLVVATTREEAERAIGDADVLVSTAFHPLTADLLQRAERLRLIQVAGAGVDHVDLEAARARGVTVAAVAGANAGSVAEHVVLAALALLRGLVPSDRALHAGEWPLAEWMAGAHDLAGRTVGIVGMGRIGREVAARLLPFGVGLLYHDVRRLPPEEEAALGLSYADLEALLAASDLVTLHLPLTPQTRGLLDAGRIARMKRGALLVNTARAELVDEAALAEALRDGRLAGAAVDVFHPEPPPADHPLRGLPNVLLTPHGAGVTVEAQERIAQAAVQNILRWLDGRPLADVVLEGGAR